MTIKNNDMVIMCFNGGCSAVVSCWWVEPIGSVPCSCQTADPVGPWSHCRMIWKIFLTCEFSHFTLTEPHRCHNYSLSLYFNKKKIFRVDPFTYLLARIETVSKIVGLWSKDPKWRPYRYILLQSRTHIMPINQHYCVLHAFSVSRLTRNIWIRRRIDSSSIIAHPVNFDIQRDR